MVEPILRGQRDPREQKDEAMAIAEGLRESAEVAGGALGVRLRHAAAMLEKMARKEAEPETEADAFNALMIEMDDVIALVRLATHAVSEAEDGEEDFLPPARNTLHQVIAKLDRIRDGIDARIVTLDTEVSQ